MHLPLTGHTRASLAVSILLAALSPAAFSQSTSDIESIRAQIEALRAEQARIADMQRQTGAKIEALEANLETDAVLGAFSQDNIGIGTNYELHALTLDYMLMPKTQLSAFWYHYKPETPSTPAATISAIGWIAFVC